MEYRQVSTDSGFDTHAGPAKTRNALSQKEGGKD